MRKGLVTCARAPCSPVQKSTAQSNGAASFSSSQLQIHNNIKMAEILDRDLEKIVLDSVIELGYDNLKAEQKAAIMAFLQSSDVFVILPTGYGKSLCYSCLPVAFDKIKKRLYSHHDFSININYDGPNEQANITRLSAVRVGDTCSDVTVNQKIMAGKYQLVFVSPETILTKRKWRKMLLSDIYQ